MSINVSHITKFYGEQKALDDVSFEISKGEIVGFLGPNGAGKSTMMKILTCFIPQTHGTASVCGFDTIENSLEVRKKIGYLPEHNPLYNEMFIKEYLEFVAGIYKVQDTHKKIKEIITITGLEKEKQKKIGALSKGYRQRVGLAQALIHNPEVLILDEPTTGLDPNQLVEIRNLIKQIGKEKVVLFSTHIMQEVEAICDRVLIINKGQIVADKNAKDLIKGTKNKQIITVEFNKDISRNLLANLSFINAVKKIDEKTWQLESVSDNDIRTDIFQFAVQNNLAVLSMQQQEQKLEDIFKQLTK